MRILRLRQEIQMARIRERDGGPSMCLLRGAREKSTRRKDRDREMTIQAAKEEAARGPELIAMYPFSEAALYLEEEFGQGRRRRNFLRLRAGYGSAPSAPRRSRAGARALAGARPSRRDVLQRRPLRASRRGRAPCSRQLVRRGLCIRGRSGTCFVLLQSMSRGRQ